MEERSEHAGQGQDGRLGNASLTGPLSLLAGRLTRPAVFGGERTAEDAGGLAVKRMGYALDIAQACDAN